MNPNLNPPKPFKLIKSVVFRTKLYYAKADQRLRVPALPKELSMLARELEGREVWAILLSLDRELEIELPWIITKRLKQIVFSEAKDEKDIKEALAFIAFDTINTYMRLLMPNVPSILYRDPTHLEMKKIKVEGVEGVWLKATGFAIWPTQGGEKVSNAIAIEAELFDISDDKDVFTHSSVVVKINLMELLEETGIRWDISRM